MLVAMAAVGGSTLFVVLLISDVFQNADRPSAKALAVGQALYQKHCASCHGANLEGQPDWQMQLPSGRLPAPPHDASGHTWHHSDRLLFAITKYGTAAVVGRGHQSDMPGFEPVLGEDQIRAVLAFIKSTWPEREQQYQLEMSRRDAAERRSNTELEEAPGKP